MSEWTQERSKQCGPSKWVSGASKWANRRAIGPALGSRFLAVLTHCELPQSTVDLAGQKICFEERGEGDLFGMIWWSFNRFVVREILVDRSFSPCRFTRPLMIVCQSLTTLFSTHGSLFRKRGVVRVKEVRQVDVFFYIRTRLWKLQLSALNFQ